MGLLDQLWDDTVAGPRPDSGLGKLRKHSTFSFRSNSGKESEVADNRKSFAEAAAEEAVRVTRSIMIVKPPQAAAKDSPPASPAGSTPPVPEEEKLFGSAGGQHHLHTKRLAELDPGALLLLTTCEI
ncbi:dormancy-associated protein homolog 3 isoform X2 [Sesamum indicum]|uniref:Dormancy-associated protein homolog 3 isoform X2 n=1 Tax=Sesamum indicum TaxID=4182 RepID=A0A8M8V1J6_SESIN|nr:dormancy-associated protein homolog 3 isoform X2 [Sesamum indicum]